MTCSAIRSNGEPCKANARPGGALCWAHDPELRAKATQARKAGGHGKSNTARAQKRMPREVRDIVAIVEAAMGGVLQGKITPSQAHATASLAGAWVRLHEIGELTLEVQEIKASLEGKQWRA